MMDEIISYCGMTCDSCQIYLATREEDDEKRGEMRVEIAQVCTNLYGSEFKPEDITDCDGCLAEGKRLLSGCKNCQIRNCAKDKGVENCAHCGEYVCEKLEEFFKIERDAKKRLEEIRNRI